MLAAVFLTTLALGVLNRAIPQMNVFVIGMPVQLAMGIFITMVFLPLYVTALHVIFNGMDGDMLSIIKLLKG
jgi:flagellar biosynthetic protein FliR